MAWSWILAAASLASWSSHAYLEAPLLYAMVTCSTVLAIGYWFMEIHPPLLAVGDGPWKDFLYTHVPALRTRVAPTPWLLEGRLHTVVASVLADIFQPALKYRREIITFKDGGEVALDWLDAPESLQQKNQRVVVLVLPGLTGDSSSSYMRTSLRVATRRGLTCAVYNNRGTGGLALKNTINCSMRHWQDVKEAVDHIRKVRHEDILVGLGFSNGGLLLTHLATADSKNIEAGARPLVDAAVTVSTPWDVRCSTRSLSRGFNRFFSYILAVEFQQFLRTHKAVFQSFPYFSPALKATSVYEFDKAFTAPHLGYSHVDDFYKASVAFDKVHLLKTPMLAINAADDPFLPMEGVPVESAAKSQHVAILAPPRGGHLGFREGLFGHSDLIVRVWDEFLAAVSREPDLLQEVFKQSNQTTKQS